MFVLSTELLLLLRLGDFQQFPAVPLCSHRPCPRRTEPIHPLAAPQSHPAQAREHRSPLCEACSVKQTAYGIPRSASWSHLVWLLFLQLVINKHKQGIWGAVMLDIHTLTAQMVLYRDYRLPGRGARREEPHTAAHGLYLFPAMSRT